VIVLSTHAEEAMVQRRVRRDWIDAAVTAPDRTEPDPGGGGVTRSFKAIPDFGGRILRVVHRPEGDDILVITAFFDRGART